MISENERLRNLAFLERVEQKRIELNMQKAELFARSGITSGSFSQWRTGFAKPSARSVAALAKVLNTTEDFLMYGDAEKPAFDSGLSNAQKELLSIIPFLSEQEATVLLATAKAQASVRKAPGGQG